MQAIEQQFDIIKEITCSIVEHLEKDEFEEANVLLNKRLASFKQLDEDVNLNLLSLDKIYPRYQSFLLEMQQRDNIRLELLLKEKSKLMAQSLQQIKTKTAISAYKAVKLS